MSTRTIERTCAPEGTFPVAIGATIEATPACEYRDEYGDWIRTYPLTDGTTLTVTRERPWRQGRPVYVLRLYASDALVAVGQILGVREDAPAFANAMCWIETHPDHQGHRYSSRMVHAFIARYGTVYRSGTLTPAGAANARYLDLPLSPGNEVHLMDPMQPNKRGNLFVDWATGRPEHF